MNQNLSQRNERDLWLACATAYQGSPEFDLRRCQKAVRMGGAYVRDASRSVRDDQEPWWTRPRRDWSDTPRSWLTPADAHWPAPQFRRGVLRMKGHIPDGFRVAIVGARRADAYGMMMAKKIACAVVQSGGTVVSGGAFGIDIAAHQGARESGGSTVCILGSGLDHPTPKSHLKTFHEILTDGAIISPFKDTQRGAKWTYPYRNPWIVALSECVVVVQAGARSGALSTGRFALSHNIPVFCLYTRSEHPLQLGIHQLIQEGAMPMGDETSWRAGILGLDPVQLSLRCVTRHRPPYGARVWDLFSNEPKTVTTISMESGRTDSQLIPLIARLELDGWLQRLPGLGYVSMNPGRVHVRESD